MAGPRTAPPEIGTGSRQCLAAVARTPPARVQCDAHPWLRVPVRNGRLGGELGACPAGRKLPTKDVRTTFNELSSEVKICGPSRTHRQRIPIARPVIGAYAFGVDCSSGRGGVLRAVTAHASSSRRCCLPLPARAFSHVPRRRLGMSGSSLARPSRCSGLRATLVAASDAALGSQSWMRLASGSSSSANRPLGTRGRAAVRRFLPLAVA
jgi:hypothetical protein